MIITYKSTILIKATENHVLVILKHVPTLKNCINKNHYFITHYRKHGRRKKKVAQVNVFNEYMTEMEYHWNVLTYELTECSNFNKRAVA